MKFLNKLVTLSNGTFMAFPAGYGGPTELDASNVFPDGSLLLNTLNPTAELAVRLATESGEPVGVLGNEVILNTSNRTVGLSPADMMTQASALRAALVAANAGEGIISSPANVGKPTIMSYLTDPDASMTEFVKELCMGTSTANDAYNGIQPADLRVQAMGHDGLYVVYTDAEATAVAQAAAGARLDEMIGNTPTYLHKYIDATNAKLDMTSPDNGGRGGLLAHDGAETKVSILNSGGTAVDYFVYRKA